jgi:membrane-bound lytic murein transglycosylase D
MRFKLICIIFFLAIIKATGAPDTDTIIIKADNSSERFANDLDSLVNTWYVKMAIQNLNDSTVDTLALQMSDDVYEQRLSRINSIISLPYNSIIRNHIHVYTVRQRKKFSAVLGLRDYYFPMIEDVFDSYGLPAELKYMAVIESVFNPGVVNRHSGATGMWQFMYSTGRMYGLTINSIVDERKDPVKATHAAARYLKDLYQIYNDWMLVIAAYNCGPGNVNKAIKRSGNKKDYWQIYYRLPRETRGYIPMYVAAVYAINYFPEHGIIPLPLNIPVATDTIMVNKDIHLAQISQVLNIPLGELQALNPQYKTGLVPGSSKPQSLTLPMNHVADFIDLNDTIRRYKSDVYLSRITRIADPTRSSAVPIADIKGKSKIIYTVKDGDNIGYISEWYKVGLSDLRNWNNIYKNNIRVGQKIVVYVNPTRSEYFSKINTMSLAEKQAMTGKAIPQNTQTINTMPEETEGEFVTYTVRNGDTIWDIVKLYGNVTTTQVLALNNISDASKIKVGQKLKIKKKS